MSHPLFLPVGDAFASKLLSRRWRRLQVPFSNLYFNQNTMFGRVYGDSCLEKLKCEFVERVDWFLKLFRGPYPNVFTVDFWLDNELASAIDNSVSFAVSMQANITCDTRNQILPFHLLPKHKPFEKGGGGSPRLKHLKLSTCLLLLTPPPPYSPFNCLKTLGLQNLPLDQTSLDGVLSSCLELEWLTLKECELPLLTLRLSSARLRGLRIHRCWEPRTIELNAAQFQAFEVCKALLSGCSASRKSPYEVS